MTHTNHSVVCRVLQIQPLVTKTRLGDQYSRLLVSRAPRKQISAVPTCRRSYQPPVVVIQIQPWILLDARLVTQCHIRASYSTTTIRYGDPTSVIAINLVSRQRVSPLEDVTTDQSSDVVVPITTTTSIRLILLIRRLVRDRQLLVLLSILTATTIIVHLNGVTTIVRRTITTVVFLHTTTVGIL